MASLPTALRVRAWDAGLATVRQHFRSAGLREVSTPARIDAGAIEPYIQPIGADGQWLQTSPELAMKRLLCAGAGPIFQVAHVFREAEQGDLHREEFHLVEWYRDDPALELVQEDVEDLVAKVFDALGQVSGIDAPTPPRRWERVELLDLMEDTLGSNLPAQGDVAAVFRTLQSVRQKGGIALDHDESHARFDDPKLAALLLWTELFSLWSDLFLDPYLRSRPEVGVHIVGFPDALAALSRVREGKGLRFESYALGYELANGYEELRDAAEQRLRFERVNALRRHHGREPLPLPEAFLSDLEAPGLPPCSGCALGLDRLLMLACGKTTLADIELT